MKSGCRFRPAVGYQYVETEWQPTNLLSLKNEIFFFMPSMYLMTKIFPIFNVRCTTIISNVLKINEDHLYAHPTNLFYFDMGSDKTASTSMRYEDRRVVSQYKEAQNGLQNIFKKLQGSLKKEQLRSIRKKLQKTCCTPFSASL